MPEPTEAQIDAADAEAEALSVKVLEVLGLQYEENPPAFVGKISLAVAGAALGRAAARLMAAATDESFVRWIAAVLGERSITRAKELREH